MQNIFQSEQQISPVSGLDIALNCIAINGFKKQKDIDRRQKGIGRMAYMLKDTFVRLSGAFLISQYKITGP